MWRARAPSRRLGSTRSRRGASRRSTTCTRSAPPASPAPSSDARCTKAASPSSRRSSARPRDEGEAAFVQRARSEEHTSELQSQLHLVCRLLLEKKNIWFDLFLLPLLLP